MVAETLPREVDYEFPPATTGLMLPLRAWLKAESWEDYEREKLFMQLQGAAVDAYRHFGGGQPGMVPLWEVTEEEIQGYIERTSLYESQIYDRFAARLALRYLEGLGDDYDTLSSSPALRDWRFEPRYQRSPRSLR